MQSAQNLLLNNVGDMGLGDQLVQQLQNQLDERRKLGTAEKNPLELGDITQSQLGMAASLLGFGNPNGPGGPLAKSMGLV